MKKRTTIPGIVILSLTLLGMSECGGGEAATEGEALTRSQKDSLVAELPIPDDVALVRNYPAGRDAAKKMAQWQRVAPECQFKILRGKIYVKGRLEDLERIEGGAPPVAEDSPTPNEPPPLVSTSATCRSTVTSGKRPRHSRAFSITSQACR